MSLTLPELERRRASLYRVTPARRIRTLAAAARFIDQVGFCWLFAPGPGVPELPSLFEAVKGKRDMHIENWDEDSDLVWGWKNELAAVKRAYYGKALAARPGFVSLEMLPYLLAVLGEQDVRRLYASGGISYDARRIYDVLERSGPTPTQTLRISAGFATKEGGQRYRRALDELQHRLIVMPVGSSRHGNAWPQQIFELVNRWFPEQAAKAQKLDLDESRLVLAHRYLRTVLAAKPPALARLFNLTREQLPVMLEGLTAARLARIEGEWVIGSNR